MSLRLSLNLSALRSVVHFDVKLVGLRQITAARIYFHLSLINRANFETTVCLNGNCSNWLEEKCLNLYNIIIKTHYFRLWTSKVNYSLDHDSLLDVVVCLQGQQNQRYSSLAASHSTAIRLKLL